MITVLKIVLLILLCIPVFYLVLILLDKLYIELINQEKVTPEEKLRRTAINAAQEPIKRKESTKRKRGLHIVRKK